MYFLKEIEYFSMLKNLNCENKIRNFSEVLSCIENGIKNELLSDDELISFNYETFFDD